MKEKNYYIYYKQKYVFFEDWANGRLFFYTTFEVYFETEYGVLLFI